MLFLLFIAGMLSRMNFKYNGKVTLGLFAPDPNQGPEDPGPAIGEIALLG